ncbi:hypothetical protein JR316_0003992 [Psilocybe cubensis]|uniref:Uncharacterized protein n=2 Tax=Psilocybe cubensis TaxID=181762 RepID=A0A8H7Y609_PSICU|nr:hypothetical protein JR316_0003992 [Psilocybe cubensis]KAH9484510.1 hypothetical protein JR316_0003992 [Psilocybe cubensis]
MSHLQHQTHYVHYSPPHLQHQHQHQHQQLQQQQPLQQHAVTHVAPQDTQHQQNHHQQQPQNSVASTSTATEQTQQPAASNATPAAPLIAKGDWTKDLVQLAKTAELKKHALTLQLHTAHILSAHATLEQKGKAIQDLREQKNKLESERARLLASLAEVNADRDKVDLMEASLEKECRETRTKITQLTETDYAVAKADVDRLRQELGQPPLPSLQSTLDEKTSQYLTERRISGNDTQTTQASSTAPARSASALPGSSAASTPGSGAAGPSASTSNPNNKRTASAMSGQQNDIQSKRPRGRPKGSKNKNKISGNDGD